MWNVWIGKVLGARDHILPCLSMPLPLSRVSRKTTAEGITHIFILKTGSAFRLAHIRLTPHPIFTSCLEANPLGTHKLHTAPHFQALLQCAGTNRTSQSAPQHSSAPAAVAVAAQRRACCVSAAAVALTALPVLVHRAKKGAAAAAAGNTSSATAHPDQSDKVRPGRVERVTR